MILGVRSNKESFRAVKFEPGFNVIFADRTPEATSKDSRNGLGKSTLIDIIHFCLGSNVPEKFRVKDLEGWIFTLDLMLRGRAISVSRGTTAHGYVVIDADNDWSLWPIQPEFDNKKNEAQIRIENWKKLLGWLLYNLPIDDKRDFTPKFRSLISYKIRNEQFDKPFENHPKQFLWDLQVHNAFMLDLNWEHARQWQLLRERKADLDNLKKATKKGNNLLASMLGTVGLLENDRARLTRLSEKEQNDLENFRVYDQYEQIQKEANDVSLRIRILTNDAIHQQLLVEFYEKNLAEEQAANDEQVSEIYRKAKVSLPGVVIKQLEDVQAFHNQVTQNRRNYLQSEIQRLRNLIKASHEQRNQLSENLSGLMKILESHGALAEYNQLQQRYVEHRSQLEIINNQIDNLKKIDREGSQIKLELERLYIDARIDYDERITIHQARDIFNQNSEDLYEVPGYLIVDIKDGTSGYSFKVDIKRDGSDGIDKMKVFCYDLMIAELWAQKEMHPQFLVHDSTLFADVDERQIALALQLAYKKTIEFGFQYIVLLNSDKIPWNEFSEDFNLRDYVRLVLTDDKPEGSLLGIRF
jgi:uncharacterized protein YydD (DUF2326 family)